MGMLIGASLGTQSSNGKSSDQLKLGRSLLSQYARGEGTKETIGSKDKPDYTALQNWTKNASKEDLKRAHIEWQKMKAEHRVPESIGKQVDQLIIGQEARRGTGAPRKPGYAPTTSEKIRNEAYQGARKSLQANKLEDFADQLAKVDSRELKLLLDDASESKVAKRLVEAELASRAKTLKKK